MDLLDKNFDYTYAITNRYDIPNQFIEVNNAKISIDYYHDAKKEFNNKRKNEIEKKKKEEKIINDETKKINFNEKLFETKYKNYIETNSSYH